jgi:hypothetical protein
MTLADIQSGTPVHEGPITLAGLSSLLGTTLLAFDAPLPSPARTVTGVWLAEHDWREDIPPGSLVLVPGMPGSGNVAELFDRVSAAAAAGVILRAEIAVAPEEEAAALSRGLALIRLADGASWLQLASVLQTLIGMGREPSERRDSPTIAEPNLFDLANSLARIIGGPVTIENLDSRILAFSADQADADEARKLSVLGHQVPAEYADILHREGTFRAIYESETPVFLPSIAPGIRPRVGMRVRAGGETLGSIWVVVDQVLVGHKNRALCETADIVALSLLRTRTAADAAGRLRHGLLMMLLEGGAAAEEAAARIGFAAKGTAVLAAGLVSADGGTAEREAELDRIASAMSLHLDIANPLSVSARVGGTVYGVLPVTGAQSGSDQVHRVAEELIARLRREDMAIGLGRVVRPAGRLNRSRFEADAALRVMLSRLPLGASQRVASGEELQAEALIMRLSDALTASGEEVSGPLAVLHEHDRRHSTEFIRTLSAWLDSFGDVAAAAAAVHVHQNTFRYRFRKLCDVAEIDPANSEQRFALMLKLRLFPLAGGH